MVFPKLYVTFALGVICPPTTNPARVPTEVMFGCAAVVRVPVNRVADSVPDAALNDRFALDDSE